MTNQINIRIDPVLKKEVHAIFKELGIEPSTAISMFYSYVKHNKKMPPLDLGDIGDNDCTILGTTYKYVEKFYMNSRDGNVLSLYFTDAVEDRHMDICEEGYIRFKKNIFLAKSLRLFFNSDKISRIDIYE